MMLLSADAPPMGRIVGGWEYVWAAYIITWAAVVLYALSLWVRARTMEQGGAISKEKQP